MISAPEESSESSESSSESPGQDWRRRPEMSLSIPTAKEIVAIENVMEEEKEDREEREAVVIEREVEREKVEGVMEGKELEIVIEAAEPMEANAEELRLSETATESSRPSEVPIEVPKFQTVPITPNPFTDASNPPAIESSPFPTVQSDPNPFPSASPPLPMAFLLPPPIDPQESAIKPAARPNSLSVPTPVLIPSVPTMNRVKSPVRPSPKPVEKSRAVSTAPRKSEPISKKAGVKPNSPKATYAPKAIPKTRR